MHPGCHIEQVYLCQEPIDFRKAINGLSVMVEQELGLNPFGSAAVCIRQSFAEQNQGIVLAPQRVLPVAKAFGKREISLAETRRTEHANGHA